MRKDRILIADSGATKTDWALCGGEWSQKITTTGMNPYHMTDETLGVIIAETLLPRLERPERVGRIAFYGAGCRAEGSERMRRVLQQAFPAVERIEVASDLLGAARALLGRREGVACILGTGSNSGLYDGQAIVKNVPPLGYVLGDEGSGATLGRRLVGDVLKGQLPGAVCEAFLRETSLTVDEVLNRVYRQPQPNRFLASLAPFLSLHRAEPAVRQLLVEEFERFLQRNVAPYRRADLPVAFVGSIAFYFKDELAEAVRQNGLRLGRICKSPLAGLDTFHTNAKEEE